MLHISNYPIPLGYYSDATMALFHSSRIHRSTSLSANPLKQLKLATRENVSILYSDETTERIKKMFSKVELSISPYDTAWVAMVPSPDSPQVPCFPQCLDWLLNNQSQDGSWSPPQGNPFLIKDVLSSTLACVLALKQWGLGAEQVIKGIHFLKSNFSLAKDDRQQSPIGFDIIFPGMIEVAKDLDIDLCVKQEDVNFMFYKRDLEIKRCLENDQEGPRAYLAYVSEGMRSLQNWENAMKYQRNNGSLFNSPSTTAAALTYLPNDGCLNYLCLLLEKFGDAVPAVYPQDVHAQLFLIDCLERLGIHRHFRNEIQSTLEETYRCWLRGEEEIFLDPSTCAMAFRILRGNGYDVSTDPLTQFIEKEQYSNSLQGFLKDINAALELFRASQIIIHPWESDLGSKAAWINQYLKEESSKLHSEKVNKFIAREVDNTLRFPYHATLERLSARRNLENYNLDNRKILKTSYYYVNAGNEDLLKLAVEDFNICQSKHHEEVGYLERWVIENRLDALDFARQKLAYCYFAAAATLFSPELSDARLSWAKNAVLTTVVDDFFDVGGSQEELLNLIQLFEKWDVNLQSDCCSERVRVIFSALQSTISELGEKAYAWQGRDVTNHVIEIWLNLLKSMLREAEWLRNKAVPKIEEYMENGYVSFALGPIVLPALYFVGPKLPEEIVKGPEIQNLYKLMSTCGRLLNDIQGFKRDSEAGKLNAVTLNMLDHGGFGTKEDVVKELEGFISFSRRELLRLVLTEKGSRVPRECKELFWKMSKVLHLFYMNNDGFTSPHEMMDAVNTVLYKPVDLATLKTSSQESEM